MVHGAGVEPGALVLGACAVVVWSTVGFTGCTAASLQVKSKERMVAASQAIDKANGWVLALPCYTTWQSSQI